ncbi:hypothetical protein NQ317_001993 [Molorchus minor]|uniref:Uncharacterized protein n=1 Tax=Molorchus minor TaxID=1323400 RepID=A0ABQ9IRA0_9CUCU|nr:hypothetical protein NQ317_001993 [Molorchus minor]
MMSYCLKKNQHSLDTIEVPLDSSEFSQEPQRSKGIALIALQSGVSESRDHSSSEEEIISDTDSEYVPLDEELSSSSSELNYSHSLNSLLPLLKPLKFRDGDADVLLSEENQHSLDTIEESLDSSEFSREPQTSEVVEKQKNIETQHDNQVICSNDGQTLMVGRFGPNDILKVSGLLSKMQADNISYVAKKDVIICEVARRYIRSHKEKHLLAVAKKTYEATSKKENSSDDCVKQFKALTNLIETDWANELSSEAGQNLAINKFNKPTLIPLTEDIMKYEKYLNGLIIRAKTELGSDSKNAKAYRDLLDGLFCSILIFNKRRVGELQRMQLSTFLNHYESFASSEFEKALTESERIMSKSLKRIVIRGKRGRGVPVLFDRHMVESIELCTSLRKNFISPNNIYLFALPGSENSTITGTAVMRKHAKIALGDARKASMLTSTKLRKHLATVTQILKMDKGELEQLATFMGHTGKTHNEFYRLPNDVFQTAKISKLLLLSKSGSIDQYKGQNLKDIDIGLDVPDECDDSDPLSNDDTDDDAKAGPAKRSVVEHEAEEMATSTLLTKKGKKRNLIPWTDEQKTLTEAFLRVILKRKYPLKNLKF